MLCDFHREQAWELWMRRIENGVADRERGLSLLRRLAHATSYDEFEAAYKSLRESEFWENQRLKEYMLTYWIPVSHMWVKYYRQQLSVVITTNNGTESQNKLLKQFYLQGGHGRKSLTGLIAVLVNQFFPDRHQHFCQENIRRSSCYRKYHEGIPHYLQNRPPSAVNHIMNRFEAALCYGEGDVTRGHETGIFTVKSSIPGKFHTVDFNSPSCSCQDCSNKVAMQALLCRVPT